ncbi:MAG: hypothetical protein WBG90_17745 [Saonia sp.]
MKIGIVTCKEVSSLTTSEQALLSLFGKKNIIAEALVWDDPSINWAIYDNLIIRSIWDYHLHPETFSAWLRRIENYGIKTLNPISTIRSNQHKFYLKKLEEEGVKIVPSLFIDQTPDLDLSRLKELEWQQAVIKPAISASAFLTEMFVPKEVAKVQKKYKTIAFERDLLVQKFMPEVQSFGELSLLFFNGHYSHTVLKKAASGEFRVQSEYGGITKPFEPDNSIIATASHILSQFGEGILYARVDGLIKEGEFILMEIELIEPDLFFEYRKGSIEMFVAAAIQMMEQE